MKVIYYHGNFDYLIISTNDFVLYMYSFGIVYVKSSYHKMMKIDLFNYIEKNKFSNVFQYKKKLQSVYKKMFGL